MRKSTIHFLLLLLLPMGVGAQSLNEELIAAVRKSNVEAVKTLLAKGADANAKTEYGATPLFFACDRGNAEIVKLLLAHGADATITDAFYKTTPIFWAARRDRAEVIKVMLEKVPQSKQTIMSQAAAQGHPATARMLPLKLYEGLYKNEQLEITIKVNENKLIGLLPGQELVLVATGKQTFELEGQPALNVVFNLDGEKVAGLTIKRPGGETVLKKAEVK
jgi:hypothetical protein